MSQLVAAPSSQRNLAYHERLKQTLPGGVFYNFNMPWEEVPLHFSGGRGSRLTDIDGNEYLDLYARFGAMILGHGHPEYLAALQEANRVLCVSHCDFDADALDALHRHIPSAEMIRFGLSGTEIVQMALRLARAHTGRNRFLRFENHYHGNADNIMGGRVLDPTDPVPVDFRGDFKGTAGRATNILAEQSYLLPWNDVERLEGFFAARGEELACVVAEPVAVNGGSVEAAPEFWSKLRQLCTQYGVVLIFDEMITGVRMGLGGAQRQLGVTPDLSTFGKAIAGGGVPVSALVGRRELMEQLVSKRVIHAGTFNGYPLGTAAVAATFAILGRDDEAALRAMHHRAAQLAMDLTAAAHDVGLPFVVQGPPGCASFHVTDTPLPSPQAYDFDLISKDIVVATTLRRHGILVSSVSRLYPNAMLTDADLDYVRERAPRALAEAKRTIADIYA